MKRGNVAGIAFRDVLLLLNIVLGSLVLMVLPSINPPSADAASINPPGNLIVSIAWPEGNDDVDLWVLAPGDEKAVGYSNRGSKTANLLRDDMGTVNDSMPFNKEDVYSRGLPAGEYVVNLHCYRCSGPQKVSVEVGIANNGTTHRLLQEVVALPVGRELTVVRFRLDAAGKVVPGSVNRVFMPIRAKKEG